VVMAQLVLLDEPWGALADDRAGVLMAGIRQALVRSHAVVDHQTSKT
jgi:hypothetical protein